MPTAEIAMCWASDCGRTDVHPEWRRNTVTGGMTRGLFCGAHRVPDACAPMYEVVQEPLWWSALWEACRG